MPQKAPNFPHDYILFREALHLYASITYCSGPNPSRQGPSTRQKSIVTVGTIALTAVALTAAQSPTASAAEQQRSLATMHAPVMAAQLRNVEPDIAAKVGIGSKLNQWYREGGAWHVGLDHATAAQKATLQAHLGRNTVFFQQGRIYSLTKVAKKPIGLEKIHVTVLPRSVKRPAHQLAPAFDTATSATAAPAPPPSNQTYPNRLLDSAPFYGGDSIVTYLTYNGDDYVVSCTAATLSNKGALSTGHCDGGTKNVLWEQGFLASDNKIYYTGTYGNFTQSVFAPNKVDSELLTDVGNGFAPYAYTHSDYTAAGYITPSSQLTDAGSASVAKGTKVCADGAVTQYKCGGTVTAVNTCINNSIEVPKEVVQECGVDTVTSSSPIATHGDSGGVVIKNPSPSGKLVTVGLISAGSGNTLFISGAPYVNKQLGVSEVSG